MHIRRLSITHSAFGRLLLRLCQQSLFTRIEIRNINSYLPQTVALLFIFFSKYNASVAKTHFSRCLNAHRHTLSISVNCF